MTTMGCGGCGRDVEIVSIDQGLPSYSYTDENFYLAILEVGMHNDEEESTAVKCPDCGHVWHFYNARPLLEKVGSC
jgi:DNA-directed RNA polymerase subunit RPC12/RpoP